MGLIPGNICPKCGTEYSITKSVCPKCGARKQNASRRASMPANTARQGSPDAVRHEEDARWQLIFGLCLVAAVIIAVIVLIVTTIRGGYETYQPPVSPTPVIEEPTATPRPTPKPTPTPEVESITITFLGEALNNNEFTVAIGATVQLGSSVYPVETVGKVEWVSENADICTVSSDGLVTGVSPGWAKVYARLYGQETYCNVWVRE
jgi:hypothetical protein